MLCRLENYFKYQSYFVEEASKLYTSYSLFAASLFITNLSRLTTDQEILIE